MLSRIEIATLAHLWRVKAVQRFAKRTTCLGRVFQRHFVAVLVRKEYLARISKRREKEA
jgi:hypothetical protein